MAHTYLYNVKVGGVLALMCGMPLSSCHNDSPVPKNENTKTTVILYAVASNNLYGNLIEDKNEILEAASEMNLSGLRMLVYQVTPNSNPELLELKKHHDGSVTFEMIKGYDKILYSTDPDRISGVINDVMTMYTSDLYGLILWSHGTGLDPFTSTRSEEGVSRPILHSFGSDKDADKDSSYSDQINIDELADAIPDNFFNFIWFDACYMSGIETIYELRNKCKYFIGYPTEVFTPGMPYNLTLPYFLAEKPDLIGGANTFFNYYDNYSSSSMRVATICVVDMDKLEGIADICRDAYANSTLPSKVDLLRYTRGSIGPFYDFGQYTKLRAANSETESLVEEFEKKLNEMVLYSAATNVDFNYNVIDLNKFSGISCHYFVDDNSRKAEFYKTLDWYKRVYK
ncbi:MAG: hypothetical protein HDR88_02890 [Bacteroides sp.]|nr:hypothetical protein [Bacteroides sp.]